jgi:hypothetical protein
LEEDVSLISNNIDDVILELFGKGYSENDIDSFEKCFDIIENDKNFKHKNLSNEILKECAKSLKEKTKRLEFPKELKKYI